MIDQEHLLEFTESYLKSLVSEVSGTLDTNFDSIAPFQELGIDSFYVLKIIKKLEVDFGTLPKTLLFENFTINDLTHYFVNEHHKTLSLRMTDQLQKRRPDKNLINTSTNNMEITSGITKPVPIETCQDNSLEKTVVQNAPVVMDESEAYCHPEWGTLITRLFDNYKNEGSVSRGTRNIAPILFIGNEKRGYFNFSRSKNIVLAYAYTGPKDYFQTLAVQMLEYCNTHNLQFNLLIDDNIEVIGDTALSATPFGAIQRVLNLDSFTLQGQKMRRLRYQISKFEKAGKAHTQEYQSGSNPQIDQNIVSIIDQWCDARTKVNPLIYAAREELQAGTFSSSAHRIFLTYIDNVLQNVIIISAMSPEINGYLMDLEFYPSDMPLGGLEFAIVKIIDVLVAQGCGMLSLGVTLGPKLAPSLNADPEIDRVLDELRDQNIFNDEGNLQFKNKFRPENKTIFLCRIANSGNVDNITDIIMMIADPTRNQAPAEKTSKTISKTTPETVVKTTKPSELPLLSDHSEVLRQYGYNPLNIPYEHIKFDLKTDSWAQLTMPCIDKQMSYLYTQLQQPVNTDRSLSGIFPFEHFVLTGSGRLAEHFFYKAWANKGLVLQNLLFPTSIFHQIDKGFQPTELPQSEVFQQQSEEYYKGNLDWKALRQHVEHNPELIAFICIEVSNNAAGGYPVSIEHLRKVKNLLSEYSIPLVMDGTRIVENAQFLVEHDKEYTDRNIWDVVKEIFSFADAVVASLAKDFCVDKGGVIATNDSDLFHQLQRLVQEEGDELDVIDKKIIALSLHNKRHIERCVLDRVSHVKSIWEALKKNNIPVVSPVGQHCILIDVKQIPAFDNFDNPVASFLAWLYLNTGIRAGAHNAGMQKNTSLNAMVRLAIPVGFQGKKIEKIIEKLLYLFKTMENIPEIILQKNSLESFGNINAVFELKKYHNVSENASDRSFATSVTPVKIPALEGSAKAASVPNVKETEMTSVKVSKTAKQSVDIEKSVGITVPVDIAIVGMAGRYPDAKNLDKMWENLKQGKDCVGEIPEQRLQKRKHHDFAKAYRGGFLDDIDKFDSLFFNISPREAQMLDPQERLFLEVAWEAIEDAGYHPQTLTDEQAPRNVGVFVGAVWAMYQMMGVEEKLAGNDINPNSFLWSIANRVSYWMNLSGPSLTLDTACSSSLTAMYLACEAIYKGECSGAIVGGVNLDLHQHKFDINWAGGALSKDGVCRSFGKDANGYVAGEGVGAVFIKPLEKAIQDNDNIQGVIKSIVVNHGGRTSGYTVPNPKIQTDLILSALHKSNIDARSIGYIEAHGTGTELGDPIEITGLTNAFKCDNVEKQSCAIGSVKSNIGHLEAAAGIVGVCKVLLQMKHRQIVPSLHSSELNEFIDFKNSPFYVEQKLQTWEAKEVDGVRLPLRAGISSFGAGGSNAHIILESYEPKEHSKNTNLAVSTDSIFPLSARNEDQLHEMAHRLRNYIRLDLSSKNLSAGLDINSIVYTLQVGRKSFDHRLAIIASSKEELVEKLGVFIEGKKDEKILTGHVQNAKEITRLFNRKEKQTLIELLSQRRDPVKLAELWTDGLFADCHGLQVHEAGRRVSLPTYPFADKRHWASTDNKGVALLSSPKASLHPLIDFNESTFESQIFKKIFNDQEFFIYDHLVSDIPTLPGVAYLELARKAGEIAAGRKVRRINNILWVSPLTVENSISTQVFTDLKPNGESVQFEVYSRNDSESKTLLSQGQLSYASSQEAQAEPQYIDLDSIRARCSKVINGKEAYPLFKSFGLNLGPSFQVLQEVFKNEKETLGVLKIPEIRLNDFQDFMLHPCLVDGSLQAAMAAQLGDKIGEMFVPYSIGEVEILFPLQQNCFSYVTPANEGNKANSKLSRANVLILDEQGKILVKIHDSIGVPLNAVHEKTTAIQQIDDYSRLHYSIVWEKALLDSENTQGNVPDTLLFFDYDDSLRNHYREYLQNTGAYSDQIILVQPGTHFKELDAQTYQINPDSKPDYIRLIDELNKRNYIVNKICFNWSVATSSDQGDFQESLERGIYSFLSLCQSLIEQKQKNKIQLLYLYQATRDNPQPQHQAINGFAKTLLLENPRLRCKTVEICSKEHSLDEILKAVLAELKQNTPETMAVRYEKQQRYVSKIKQIETDNMAGDYVSQGIGLKQQGVYLITGGIGGLGLIFAQYLTDVCRARLVLTGRSEINAEQKSKVEQLQKCGADVVYYRTDVSNYQDVKKLIKKCRSRFGKINGIIHSAGVLRDSFIKNKTPEEMRVVFAPKVHGAINLDEATKNIKLDFFVMFSSLSSIGGNVGQCDYSFANHFLDSFALKRENLRAKGTRSGKSLSINWSLWADGGMKLDEQTQILFKKNLGIKPLSTEIGLDAFIQGLSSKYTTFAVLEAQQDKIERAWGLVKDDPLVTVSTEVSESPIPAVVNDSQENTQLITLIQQELSQMVMDFLKIDANDISLDAILLDLGFDSISLTTYANLINDKYQTNLTPVLFFEYPSIREIAKNLVEEHKDEVQRIHQTSADNVDTSQVITPAAPVQQTKNIQQTSIGVKKGWNPAALDQGESKPNSGSKGSLSTEHRFIDMPIAVVGMSGVMPQSDNLEEFWENLRDAKNMITLIPENRWNWTHYDGDPLTQANKTNSKWGGFMKEVDKFDPLFFGISPREAIMMDPQQRIFLQTVWGAIEDSGEKVSDLSGTKTGLFVGVATNDYTDIMNNRQIGLDGYTASGNSHSILANRVSFLLNLRGPSAPLDTACSSSLVAMHRALESIHTGSSDMAIVGGVQLMLSPAAYISFGVAGMLSGDGKCKTFDKSANGYVRGEGAGAVYIKPLSMAQTDGNPIYAIIKASAENHGGKVTTLTAPNPSAQSELLIEAYQKAQIDPTTVGYIECHGTGTSLGDPIEIQALKKSFSELYRKHNKTISDVPHCGLSSVKTNIGHLETAAGIAGMLKVLLAIKHQKIPASLHLDEINPYIDLNKSPFYIVDKTIPWKAIKGEDGNTLPRRAGVSSFGFGGANAHIILEEYSSVQPPQMLEANQSQLFVLSAKNADRLKDYALSMLVFLKKHEVDLLALTYTLQMGRDAMEQRLALLVTSVDQLIGKLQTFVDGSQSIENGYLGHAKNNKDTLSLFSSDTDLQETIEKWIAGKKFSKLLDLWVKGLDVDWSKLHGEGKHQRISLPTYPFSKERYWIDAPIGKPQAQHPQDFPESSLTVLHPLLHSNTSTLYQQSYCSTLTGKESFLKEHLSGKKKVLPEFAFIQMAQQAFNQATGNLQQEQGSVELKNVVWIRPMIIGNDPVSVNIALIPKEKGEIAYELYSEVLNLDQDRCVYSQGVVSLCPPVEALYLNLDEIQHSTRRMLLSSKDCLELFNSTGLEHKPDELDIENIYVGDDDALARLTLSVKGVASNTNPNSPSLALSFFDSALQAVTGLLLSSKKELPAIKPFSCPYVPFAMDKIEIIDDCKESMWIWIRSVQNRAASANVQSVDIDLCDDDGLVCVKIQGLCFEYRVNELDYLLQKTGKSWLSLTEQWNPSPLVIETQQWAKKLEKKKDHSILIISDDSIHYDNIKNFSQKIEKIINKKVGQLWDIQYMPIQIESKVNAKVHSRVSSIDISPYLTDLDSPQVIFLFLPNIAQQEQSLQELERLYCCIQSLLKLAATKQIQFYCCYQEQISEQSVYREGFAGLFKSAMLECTNHRYRSIAYDTHLVASGKLAPRVIEEWLCDQNNATTPIQVPMVSLENDERFELQVSQQAKYQPSNQSVVFQKEATYLLVGALGGVGELICQQLGRDYHAKLVIFSRRSETDVQENIARIEAAGATVIYRSVDVLDQNALNKEQRFLEDRGIVINGVMHMARQVLDAPIVNKNFAEFNNIMSAKVQGTLNIDAITATQPLEFFLMYSSVAAFGIKGSPDYAYSTAFQNSMARYRNRLVDEGKRKGRSLAICWGQWETDGGVDPKKMPARLNMMEQIGMDFIDSHSAMSVMDISLVGKSDVVGFIAVHEKDKVAKMMGIDQNVSLNSDAIDSNINAFKNGDLSKSEFIEFLDTLSDNDLDESGQKKIIQAISEFEKSKNTRFGPMLFKPGDNRNKHIKKNYSSTAYVNKETQNKTISNITEKKYKPTAYDKNSKNAVIKSIQDSGESLTEGQTLQRIIDNIEKVLGIKKDIIELDRPFLEYGLDSISAVQFTTALEKEFEVSVPPNWLVDNPNISALTDRLNQEIQLFKG